MKARIVATAALAALAALFGCGGDSTGPSGTSGTITFTFAGGTFTVTGAATQSGATTTTYVLGSVDPSIGTNGQTLVIGNKALGGDKSDVILIGISRATVGSASAAADCDPDGEACSGMVFLQNFGGSGGTYDAICAMETGSLAITEVSASRVKGTFSGAGECVSGTNQTSAFTVTNGSFDVALVAGLQ